MDHSPPAIDNLLRSLPAASTGEVTQILAKSPTLRIERIVSRGDCSPPGFWYDQGEDEWVVLLAGGATLEYQAPARLQRLVPGDFVSIPAGVRHRVAWTDPTRVTVWLAIFQVSAASSSVQSLCPDDESH